MRVILFSLFYFLVSRCIFIFLFLFSFYLPLPLPLLGIHYPLSPFTLFPLFLPPLLLSPSLSLSPPPLPLTNSNHLPPFRPHIIVSNVKNNGHMCGYQFKISIRLFIFSRLILCLYLSFYLSIFLSIYLSIFLSIYLSIFISFNLSIYLSTYLSIFLSFNNLNLSLSM